MGVELIEFACLLHQFGPELEVHRKLEIAVGDSHGMREPDPEVAGDDNLKRRITQSPGIAGDRNNRIFSSLDTSVFFEMIAEVNRDFPNVKAVATTLREVDTAYRHQWGAVVWCDGQQAISPTCELGVIDRIGGGDGFASGLIYGMLDGRELDEVVRLGWAHGALSTTFPGDVTMARLPEVEAFAKGGSARVQR